MSTTSRPVSSSFLRSDAIVALELARSRGEKIIFTSGSFDLLHAGHIAYLEFAKQLGGFVVVGVNSDKSVAAYKDPRRPINSETQRAAVVAGLRSVDAVFIFSETNNNENILAIKPDFYVKAGDYSAKTLSSAGLVESYGGSIVIAPFETGLSSSSMIDRVLSKYGNLSGESSSEGKHSPAPAVFLDRDGTINEFVEYLSEPEKFAFLPNAIAGLVLLKKHGFRLIVTTNQPGIGIGFFTREDFFRVNKEMLKGCDAAGIQIDKVYFCPDSYAVESDYRKPAPGMIQRGVKELNVDPARSYVVGDMTIDLEFARRGGCRSVLVQTGKAGKDARYSITPNIIATDLLDAAEKIIEDYERTQTR